MSPALQLDHHGGRPGYDHDVFISYGRSDDTTPSEHWVRDLVTRVEGRLHQIFTKNVSISRDPRLMPATGSIRPRGCCQLAPTIRRNREPDTGREQLAGRVRRRCRPGTWAVADALPCAAEDGYHSHVELMRSTNIADLRNRLTQYLKEVRAGEEIVVRDRQRPIAKIVPFTVDEQEDDDADLVAAGVIRKGTGRLPRSFWSTPRRGVSWEVAVAAVRADREQE